MNDEEFKKLVKDVGAMFHNMEPGPECPSNEMLLDYVYDALSEAENEKVRKHKEHCSRCRFEILKIEADTARWEEALLEDPDSAIEHALGPDGVRRVREAMTAAAIRSGTRPISVRQREASAFDLDQDTIDRIAAVAAAEVLDNVDLHMAYWKKTRGDWPHQGPYTGLAQASGLRGDILPYIADVIGRAWEWSVRNRQELAEEGLSSALAVHVSAILNEGKGLTGLNDEEIGVLSDKISQEVAKALIEESDSDAGE